MEAIICDIATRLTNREHIDADALARIIRAHNNGIVDVSQHASKKKLLPYYFKMRQTDPSFWTSRGIDAQTEAALIALLQVKPRRTASGVATITVITKPHKCSSACIYCPNDIRMPKSYLSDEPACQRAERVFFDPYLQVISRMKALIEMGHPTDKIELIVLGGTWSDYSLSYQYWFMTQLFRALNDLSDYHPSTESLTFGLASSLAETSVSSLEDPYSPLKNAAKNKVITNMRQCVTRYEQAGISRDREQLRAQTCAIQQRINAGELSYNQAFDEYYGIKSPWSTASDWQISTPEQLRCEHLRNRSGHHRVVGLVVETRPDLITIESLTQLRRFGCTKVQIGIQSLDEEVLRANHRSQNIEQLTRAFDLLRLFGFKIHTHFMVNLYGSNPHRDKADYERFMSDERFKPDEVKLYPCVLVAGTPLSTLFKQGAWMPYDDETLIDVLAYDVAQTPPYTRISRMIRDISAGDIIAGSKKTNLRQMVDKHLTTHDVSVSEIRTREINTKDPVAGELVLEQVRYQTHATNEYFLQWITSTGQIAGFLRLSLPCKSALDDSQNAALPIAKDEAMIREVHVYGKAAQLGHTGTSAQHHGLGKALIARACEIARDAGYKRINVISAIGTFEYYEHQGFYECGLYQQKSLLEP